jgi:ribosome-binding factor A
MWSKNDLQQFGRAGSRRPQRVGDLIRNEIALLLLSKIKDPRLALVSIVKVVMSKDLRKANVYFSVLGDEQGAKEAGSALAKAKGFIRKHLAGKLNMRATPNLEFFHDLSLVHHEHMDRLFKEIEDDGPASE